MHRVILWTMLFASPGLAGDVAGTWKATAEGPNGTMERTFIFKVDGETLTGETTSSMLGTSIIENGKVDGNSLSFTITVKFQDEERKLDYKGKVEGDKITLTVDAMGQTIEWHGKRIS